MKSYIDIVKKILAEGKNKSNRTGIDTIACPFVNFSHDISEGFPLLTTKKMGIKNITVELEGFLRGIPDKKWYQDRGCHVWDEWANPQKVQETFNYISREAKELSGWTDGEYRKEIQLSETDLGPIYGYQWRKFGEQYGEVPIQEVDQWDIESWQEANGLEYGSDQLKTILQTLKQNPNDRRMVCSAWNPNQMNMMALPACTVLWNVVVIDDTLNLGWFQRSCDVMLGLPYDIASHAIILLLLAKYSGLKPGILHGTLADCHIYKNHIENAKEQIKREIRPLPQCNITVDPFDLHSTDIVKWTHNDIKLENYVPHPKIEFEVAI